MNDEEVQFLRGIGDAAVIHRYPYSSLPLLECHVHPKFAIFDAGRKLKKMLFGDHLVKDALRRALEDYPSLLKIQRLYRAWIQDPPSIALEDKTYVNPEFILVYSEDGSGDDHSNDSDYDHANGQPKRTRTIPGRGDGFHLYRRTLLLSKAALSRINQEFGETAWTADHIRQWSSDTSIPKKRKFQATSSESGLRKKT
jgi:hypothetical protein